MICIEGSSKGFKKVINLIDIDLAPRDGTKIIACWEDEVLTPTFFKSGFWWYEVFENYEYDAKFKPRIESPISWVEKTKDEAIVFDDDWHCDPECPHLVNSRHGDLTGFCTLHGVSLMWYDYYISYCTQGVEQIDSFDEKELLALIEDRLNSLEEHDVGDCKTCGSSDVDKLFDSDLKMYYSLCNSCDREFISKNQILANELLDCESKNEALYRALEEMLDMSTETI
ncbi:hypothetical protein N9043_00825 [bacterium]|nr:hypothetical protein [bacterium]